MREFSSSGSSAITDVRTRLCGCQQIAQSSRRVGTFACSSKYCVIAASSSNLLYLDLSLLILSLLIHLVSE